MCAQQRSAADSLSLPTPAKSDLSTLQTRLALDHATLAWLRTTLSVATFGFGMAGFFRTLQAQSQDPKVVRLHQGTVRMGIALLILGIVATILAAIAHWQTLQKLRRGETISLSNWPLSITVAMLVAITGLVGLWQVITD